jgi:hypothetical protein
MNREMLLMSKGASVAVNFYESKAKLNIDDVFCFCNMVPENILDLQAITTTDFAKLTQIFKSSPLYKTQLTFALDFALQFRQRSDELSQAINKAFHPLKLPEPYKSEKKSAYEFKGELQYQFLDTVPMDDLLQIYLNCLNIEELQNFEELLNALDLRHIVDANAEKFFQIYDGFKGRDRGCANLNVMIRGARRIGYDPDVPIEAYSDRGADIASRISVSSAESLINLWMRADKLQSDYCELLDAALANYKNAGRFKWVKGDIFNILEAEAMKQVYAKKLFRDFDAESLLRDKRHLRDALKLSAKDGVDDNIQKLLTQSLNSDFHYAGVAENFVKQASERELEYALTEG